MSGKWKYVIGLLGLAGMMTACGKEEVKTPVDVVIESTTIEETTESVEIKTEEAQSEVTSTVEENSVEETTEEMSEVETETETEQTPEEVKESALNDFMKLTEGDLEARREQQRNFQEAREMLYTLENSIDKTLKINQMDRQILANNAYPFFDKTIVFIGDSITEGVGAAFDTIHDNTLSYAVYAGDALHAKRAINNGKGGRMFSDYGGDELSLVKNYDNVINNGSDIIVVFAGANDYFTAVDQKRFGDINNTMSTAGYCGAARYFFNALKRDFPDRTVFVVLMYDFGGDVKCNYSDITYNPTLNDYLDVQRKLAKECGFQIIDLYEQGFMDCTTEEAKDYFLDDFVHPKDMGSIMLGEHVAAEISYYFSQKQ